MSDEAKVAYLQEKIHEARRYQTIGFVSPIAVGFPLVPLFAFLGVPENITLIFGGVHFLGGWGLGYYYTVKKMELMEQLKQMAGFK